MKFNKMTPGSDYEYAWFITLSHPLLFIWYPYPSNAIWPHLSYDFVRSKREREFCRIAIVLICHSVALCSCTVIWAAHILGLPDFVSCHRVHLGLLCYRFVCVRFICSSFHCLVLYAHACCSLLLQHGEVSLVKLRWLTTLLQCFDAVSWVIRQLVGLSSPKL